MTGFLQRGEFVLNSGHDSGFKIEVDEISDETIDTAMWLAYKSLPYINEVVSVPRGGDRMARSFRKYLTTESPKKSYNVLIVDDVLTTGYSMEKVKGRELNSSSPFIQVYGIVLFSRLKREYVPSWIVPVFQMNDKFVLA